MSTKIRVGLVGYGSLGQFLANAILNDEQTKQKFELVFVWNRSIDKLASLPTKMHLSKLEDFATFAVDLIVEVCHPQIVEQFGVAFLKHADLFVGSPTAFANATVEKELRGMITNNTSNGHSIYVPSGALWGAQDIQKMSLLGSLQGLTISMKKHPLSLKLDEPLKSKVDQYIASDATGECIIYQGDVRTLCPLAPNNVNTMACAALAGANLGFDKTQALLIADKSLEAHIVGIIVEGKGGFKVSTERYNPAKVGAVTGNATYFSFLSSLLLVGGRTVSGFYFV